MHVFVTGGTGTIGSAVVAELLGNGHTVLALARSDGSAQTLKDAGAEVLRGGLADLDVLRAGAAQSDGVISLAFGRDYSSADALAAAIAEESAAHGRAGSGAHRQRPPDRHGLRNALGTGPRLHRGRSAADRRTGRRSGPLGQCAAGPGRARCAQPRPSACRAPSTTRARAASPAC